MPQLADTHCHLDFHAFDTDREQLLVRAREAGVSRILNPSIDAASSKMIVQLAEAVPELFAAVGVHPNDAGSWTDSTYQELKDLALQPVSKVVAVGEIGLDYYRDRAPKDVQRHVFRRQLDLAKEIGLPVVIHNRDASQDVLAILREWQQDLSGAGSALQDRPGVLHSFSADEKVARKAIDLNFLIGITGPVTFKNATGLQQVVAALPLTHLLVETDAPFLTPHPHRGQRNEPAYVSLVAEKIAALQNQPFSKIAEQTSANAARLFNW